MQTNKGYDPKVKNPQSQPLLLIPSLILTLKNQSNPEFNPLTIFLYLDLIFWWSHLATQFFFFSHTNLNIIYMLMALNYLQCEFFFFLRD